MQKKGEMKWEKLEMPEVKVQRLQMNSKNKLYKDFSRKVNNIINMGIVLGHQSKGRQQ